jgi:hypothetical protein
MSVRGFAAFSACVCWGGAGEAEGACDHVQEEQQAERWAAHILHKAATFGSQWASLPRSAHGMVVLRLCDSGMLRAVHHIVCCLCAEFDNSRRQQAATASTPVRTR